MPIEPRVGQRCQRDDIGVGPSRELQEKSRVILEDLCRCFERVLQGVPDPRDKIVLENKSY
jgi:hypothetical protein